jgi:hypothetical protein
MQQLAHARSLPTATRRSLGVDFLLLCLLAAWVVWWPDLAPDDTGPSVAMPVVETLWERPHPYEKLYLTVTRDARLYLEHEPVDLTQLADRLPKRVRAYGARQRSKGKTPVMDTPGGGQVWKLNVVVRADREACRSFDGEPWTLAASIEAPADAPFEYIVETMKPLLGAHLKHLVFLGPDSVPALAVPMEAD